MTSSLSRPDTPDTYTPRHSWPYECAGERCAQHNITHRPKHRREVDA